MRDTKELHCKQLIYTSWVMNLNGVNTYLREREGERERERENFISMSSVRFEC